MISPCVFIKAQEASCDSRMMVEKPVRNSEFCISCTMPESEAFTTSRSIGLTRILFFSLATYSAVMPGPDPGIHEAVRQGKTLRIEFVEIHHGLPGQARQ